MRLEVHMPKLILLSTIKKLTGKWQNFKHYLLTAVLISLSNMAFCSLYIRALSSIFVSVVYLISIADFSHSASRIPASLFACATPMSASLLTAAVCDFPTETNIVCKFLSDLEGNMVSSLVSENFSWLNKKFTYIFPNFPFDILYFFHWCFYYVSLWFFLIFLYNSLLRFPLKLFE